MDQKGINKLIEILQRDRRYSPEAYRFVNESLTKLLDSLPQTRHVTGRELLESFRIHAIDSYGNLARLVLEEWGIFTCEDVGEIVFNLTDAGLLSKQPTDTRADFLGGYSFVAAFDRREIE
ncbi:MAG: Minf_1886 family protein [Candidatus Brocadiia bacterium]